MEKLRSESTKQNNLIQTLVNSIHAAELELNKKRQELRDREALEKRKDDANTEVGTLETKSKVR